MRNSSETLYVMILFGLALFGIGMADLVLVVIGTLELCRSRSKNMGERQEDWARFRLNARKKFDEITCIKWGERIGNTKETPEAQPRLKIPQDGESKVLY